jgi:hypothetical protein
VAARALAAALAVVCGFVAIHALHADHRCAEVKAQATTVPRAQLGAVARAGAARCGDPRDRLRVAFAAAVRGDRAAAIDLARRMTRSSPDDYLGWLTLGRLTGDRAALARAHALDPRGVPAP